MEITQKCPRIDWRLTAGSVSVTVWFFFKVRWKQFKLIQRNQYKKTTLAKQMFIEIDGSVNPDWTITCGFVFLTDKLLNSIQLTLIGGLTYNWVNRRLSIYDRWSGEHLWGSRTVLTGQERRQRRWGCLPVQETPFKCKVGVCSCPGFNTREAEASSRPGNYKSFFSRNSVQQRRQNLSHVWWVSFSST